MAITVANYQAELGFDASEFKKGMSDSEKGYASFTGKMKSLGGGLAKGLTAAIGAVTTGVTALVATTADGIKKTAEYGDNVDKMSQKIGISKQAYQEWDFILQHCGANVDGLQASMKTLSNKAQDGSDSFAKLGISMDDVASMSTEDLFSSVVSGLQNMEEGTERTAIASELLGKSATELGALFNTTAEDTEAMRQQVHDLGGVMSDDAVSAAATFQDSLQNLQTAISGLSRGALAEFLPSVTSIMDGLTMIFSGDSGGIALINQGISGFITNLSNIIPQILEIGSNIILTLMGAITQNLPSLIQGATGIIMTLVNGIIELLPSIATAAIQIITTIAQGIADNIPTLVTTVVDVLLQIVQTLLNNLPVLLDAVLQIILGLVQGILDAIPIIIEALPQVISSIIDFLIGAIPQIIDAGIKLLTSLVQALPQIINAIVAAIPQIIDSLIIAIIGSIPQIVQAGIDLLVSLIRNLPTIIKTILKAIPQIITSLVNAIANNIPAIIQAGVELLVSLVKNLPKIIVEVVKAIPQIITSLVSAIIKGVPQIANAGLNLVKGLFNGISNAVGWLYGKLKGWVSSVLSYIKGLFGIHSPSKETAVFGKYIAEGLGVGIEDNADAANAASEKLSENVLNTFEDMASDITNIENGLLDDVDVSARKKVTLSAVYDNAALNGSISNSVAISGNTLTDGLSSLFDSFIGKTETMLNKLIDSVSVGSANGVSTSNISTVINMGDISVSGVIDKGAAEQVNDIAKKQAEDVKNYVVESEKHTYSRVMEKAKKDKNFESMIQDMTFGNATGKSSLTKNKYKY